MATGAQLRRLALAMPDVEEKSHFGKPDFRVAGKIFAGLSGDEKTGTLKLTADIQSTLLHDGSPFTPCEGAWGRSGWTYVTLARVELGVLEALLDEAWRIVTPKKAKATTKKTRATSAKSPAKSIEKPAAKKKRKATKAK